jgi:hypothetical protein
MNFTCTAKSSKENLETAPSKGIRKHWSKVVLAIGADSAHNLFFVGSFILPGTDSARLPLTKGRA